MNRYLHQNIFLIITEANLDISDTVACTDSEWEALILPETL